MEAFFSELWGDFVAWIDLRYISALIGLLFISPLLHVTWNIFRGVSYYKNPAFKGRFGKGPQ